MKTSEVLYRAADVIRERGWVQGQYENWDGRVCVIGACRTVVRGQPTNADGRSLGAPVLAIKHFERVIGERAVYFNDRHCRTADDAIAALKIAADIAAAEGK